MLKKSPIEREKDTIRKMIILYCRGKHNSKQVLCHECQDLLEYAHKQLDRCKFGSEKTTCGKCPIHCYKPAMREKVKKVMRYAGPRMIFVHPSDAIEHMIKERRRIPKDHL
ncbi:nitrous oxide-stimulated promoter family protein [Desulfolucanica intricata]|uniref:nitrous oxide-stimulated promoter family protein n=1 Tax=Desulfolucanica intricata TaxID=1285191 RepID=UPI00082A51BF|nr:nitrous oxide-stimulated promoter family protein [Desulfolucanica intricata]